MTETQERFLRSVLTRVPLDTVVELHLFPPIRRGTLETGVAVIATVLPPAPLTMVDIEIEAVVAIDDSAVSDVALDLVDTSTDRPLHDPLAEAQPISAAVATLEEGDEVGEIFTGVVHDDGDLETADGDAEDIELVSEAGAGADCALDGDCENGASDAIVLTEEIEAVFATVRTPAPRMRILTASYRHTIKGVERGKWSVEVQEEADAPLAAVELVLRGVRHRSTEPADPELVSHDALAALLTPAAVAPAA